MRDDRTPKEKRQDKNERGNLDVRYHQGPPRNFCKIRDKHHKIDDFDVLEGIEDTGNIKDFDDIEELEEEFLRRRRSPLVRLVALLTMLAFLAMVFAFSWPDLEFPPAELVVRSLQLQKDIDVQRLQEAVVKIDVVSRGGGALAATERRSGTGFNIRADGLIVTNRHVVEGAERITVSFLNEKVYSAAAWVSMEDYDLAVIELHEENLPVVPTADLKTAPQSGDRIRIVGNPLGLRNVVVEGKVDQYVRVRGSSGIVFSIEAPVYPGNSGSPVFDRSGEVIGVVFARYQKEDGEKIFGLAVPISELLKI